MKKRFFKEAMKESRLSDYDGQHIGAVAVYKDKFILARAHNSDKTNTTQFYYNRYRVTSKDSTIMSTPPRSHAETNLFRKIQYLDVDFKDVVVYIFRERKDNGAPALSRPCASCRKLLHDLGIKTICYTEDGGYIEEKYEKQ